MRTFNMTSLAAALLVASVSFTPAFAESNVGTYEVPLWQMTGGNDAGVEGSGPSSEGTVAGGPGNRGNGTISGPPGIYTNGPTNPTRSASVTDDDGVYGGPTYAGPSDPSTHDDSGYGVSVDGDGNGDEPGMGDPGASGGSDE